MPLATNGLAVAASGWTSTHLATDDLAVIASGLPSTHLTADDLAVAASDLPSIPLAADDLAVAASDLPLIPLATDDLTDAASDLSSIFPAPPGSQTLSCGNLRGGMPPSPYFAALSRCANATIRSASGSLSMVARTVASDRFFSRRCRFGQSFPFEHDTGLPLPVTTFNCFKTW